MCFYFYRILSYQVINTAACYITVFCHLGRSENGYQSLSRVSVST